MNERIERIQWIEPREVAHERQAQAQEAARAKSASLACWSLTLGVGAVFGALGFSPEAAFAVGLDVAGLIALACTPLALQTLAAGARGDAGGEVTCILDLARAVPQSSAFAFPGCLWEQARSFEITDHPTIPGIRRLTIHAEGAPGSAPVSTQLHFRPAQVSEADIYAFVQARIAEPTAQRLMRRVQY